MTVTVSNVLPLKSKFTPQYIYFYWCIISLQCCVDFCCTIKSTSYMCTYIRSLLILCPTFTPTPPPRSSQPWGEPLPGCSFSLGESPFQAPSELAVLYSSFPLAIYVTHDEVKWSKFTQSCQTLCDPMDCSLQGSSIHGTFQARVLEWVAISFSRGSSWPRDRAQVSRIVGRCFTLWATREAPMIVYCKDRILLSISPFSEHIIELCQ